MTTEDLNRIPQSIEIEIVPVAPGDFYTEHQIEKPEFRAFISFTTPEGVKMCTSTHISSDLMTPLEDSLAMTPRQHLEAIIEAVRARLLPLFPDCGSAQRLADSP